MRIVHLVAPAPVGGLERVVQILAVGQRAHGHDVTVVAIVSPGSMKHPFVRQLEEAGVAVATCEVTSRQYAREIISVRRILRELAPQVVHFHGYRCDILHLAAARSIGAIAVSTAHGSSRLGGGTAWWEWIQEKVWRRFDMVIAVSRELYSALISDGLPNDRVVLIPNAWSGRRPSVGQDEVRRRLGIRPSSCVVGFVGRLIHAKGPDQLLRAAASTDLPNVSWVIVGDGALRSSLEEQAKALGIAPRVLWVGHLDDATEVFPAFDVFALPSRTEGTPIVAFEAMAAGVPVIAFGVGGVPEVLGEGSGVVVPAEDIAGFARALEQVVADEGLRDRLRARADARLVSEYSPDRWIQRHLDVYSNATGGVEPKAAPDTH
jgi:glycosyltransferase involved in cell wall biosynthesis